MLCLNPSWQAYGAWSDPACKFRLTEMAFGLKPFMLQPAENWIVGAKGHRDYENYMIFWKARLAHLLCTKPSQRRNKFLCAR